MSNKKEVLFLREEYGEGRGKYIYPNGEKYVGEWKNGKFCGQGTYTFPDGRMYVGELKNRKYNGQGTFTLPDGTKYVGEYKDGLPWNGIRYDHYGNIEQKFVNGKRIIQ